MNEYFFVDKNFVSDKENARMETWPESGFEHEIND